MKYFRLYNSSGPDIGFYPQVHDAVVNFNIYQPESAYHLNFTQPANSNTLWPVPKLSSKAKKTDLVSTSYMSLSGKLLISSRLYDIILKYNNKGIQFIKTQLIIKKGKTEDYWVVKPIISDFNFIDYGQSSFGYMDGMCKRFLEEIKISTSQEFIEIYKESQASAVKNPYPNHRPFMIKTLAFVEGQNIDFFSVAPVYGGIGFFVSERLKIEIDLANCSGIVFSEPNEKYP